MSTIKHIRSTHESTNETQEKALDENQPQESARFRTRYSTTENIHVVDQVKKCRKYNIPTLHRIRRPRESLRLESTDFASRTGNTICVHRSTEWYLHQQLDDSSPIQIKQLQQERCTTGRYHIAQAVYCSTRNHIPTNDLGNQRLEDKRRTS